MAFKTGQTVTFTHYGATRAGTVRKMSMSGNAVIVRDERGLLRWLHRGSVAAA